MAVERRGVAGAQPAGRRAAAADSALLAPAPPPSGRQYWRLLYRMPLVCLHLLIALPLTMLFFLPGIRRFRWAGRAASARAQQSWSRGLLRILAVRVRVRGALPAPPYLLVANHISWLDIVLLHAVCPLRLVAKQAIREWPVIGPLARAAGTVFLARGHEDSRRRVGRRVGALLRRGEAVGLFPEGRIHPARGVGRFHSPLFAGAVRVRVPVVPVALRYWRDGDLHSERLFGPGENFAGSVLRMLTRPPCEGQVIIGAPLWADAAGRSGLARRAEQKVREAYGQAF